MARSTTIARFASKSGRSSGGSSAIARSMMKWCAANPHACAGAGTATSNNTATTRLLACGHYSDRMLRIGAHMSVAGGVSKAVDRAVVHGCEALQIFTKNANQWRGKPLDPSEIRLFRERIEQAGITPVVSHASYLINLATTFPLLREQSLAAFADEIDRAEALGLLGVVIHPGTCTAGPDDEALRLIADAIRVTFKARPRAKTMVLLEHTAGQGRTLGYRFEHLAAIIGHLGDRGASASASTPVISSPRATTSPPKPAIATPSSSSIGSWASIG